RADKANLRFLEDHIARLNRSWNHFFSDEPPDLTWNDIITQVLVQNGLANQIAAVKIIATMGENYNPPFQHTLLVTARPYRHRLAETKEPGLKLLTYPYPRESPLADYKTLNHLFYLLAGKWAKTYGGDEALISNPDKSVSETNTANILLIKGKVLIRPVSSHVLPGIMQNAVSKLLSSWMYRIEDKKVFPEELFSADEVLITNSLMGAVPATSLDGKQLGKPSDLWQKINRRVL
ncbi:MAG: aminotransferase class IV, partial [Deltaproteobacteria bacterium]|nr:aminotransferase class IV [Deltaproteobacteria bacterium]